MRTWCLTFDNENDCNNTFAQFAEKFKDCADVKTKKVLVYKTKIDDENNTCKIFISIEDTVNGTYNFTFMNAFDKPLKIAFTSIKSDCKDNNVDIPVNCKIMTWYEPDPDHNVKKEDK